MYMCSYVEQTETEAKLWRLFLADALRLLHALQELLALCCAQKDMEVSGFRVRFWGLRFTAQVEGSSAKAFLNLSTLME